MLKKKQHTFVHYEMPSFGPGLPQYAQLINSVVNDCITRYRSQFRLPMKPSQNDHHHSSHVDRWAGCVSTSAYSHEDNGVNCESSCASYRKQHVKQSETLRMYWNAFAGCSNPSDSFFTCDIAYMESIWWAFKTLYDRGVIFKMKNIVPDSKNSSTLRWVWYIDIPKLEEQGKHKAGEILCSAISSKREGCLESQYPTNYCSVSRSSSWGTPMPVWFSGETNQTVVIGSVKELEELSGVSGIKDIDTDSLSRIKITTIKSRKTGATLRRTSEFFNDWFESVCLLFARFGYPNAEGSADRFQNESRAHLTQEHRNGPRQWFLRMPVLAVPLFNKQPPYKFVFSHGSVFRGDRSSLRNLKYNSTYLQQMESKYGSDAIRLCLLQTSSSRGQKAIFQDGSFARVVDEVFIPWVNALRCFLLFSSQLEKGSTRCSSGKHEMDLWIESRLNSAIKTTKRNMDRSFISTTVDALLHFIKVFLKDYVTVGRSRLVGMKSADEQHVALSTLHQVLLKLSILMAPFAPFFAEFSYAALKSNASYKMQAKSVHALRFPRWEAPKIDLDLEDTMRHVLRVIGLGRKARSHSDLDIRQELGELLIFHDNKHVLASIKSLEHIVKAALNVRCVSYQTDDGCFVKLVKQNKKIVSEERLFSVGAMAIAGSPASYLVMLNTTLSPEMVEALTHKLVQVVNDFRRKCDLDPSEVLESFVDTEAAPILGVLNTQAKLMAKLMNAPPPVHSRYMPKDGELFDIRVRQEPRTSWDIEWRGTDGTSFPKILMEDELLQTIPRDGQFAASSSTPPKNGEQSIPEQRTKRATVIVSGHKVSISFLRAAPRADFEQLLREVGGDEDIARKLKRYIAKQTIESLGLVKGTSSKVAKVTKGATKYEVELQLGVNVFPSTAALLRLV